MYADGHVGVYRTLLLHNNIFLFVFMSRIRFIIIGIIF
jgi:hypothetical protein